MPDIFIENPNPDSFKKGEQVFANMSRAAFSVLGGVVGMYHEAVGSGVVVDEKIIQIYPDTVIGYHTDTNTAWQPMKPILENDASSFSAVSIIHDDSFAFMSTYKKTADKLYKEGKTMHGFLTNHCGRNNSRTLDLVSSVNNFKKYRPQLFNEKYCTQNFGSSTIGIPEAQQYHQKMVYDICKKSIIEEHGDHFLG